MFALSHRRLALVLAVLLGGVPAVLGTPRQQPAPKTEYFNGKVVPLASMLEKQGAKLDPDAVNVWLVLVADDGKVFNLLKDDGSRMFFMEKTLLDRPMRLTARQLANTQILQVINVHSYLKGQLHEVYWWCDICSIRDSQPGDCHCCGAKFVYREEPVK